MLFAGFLNHQNIFFCVKPQHTSTCAVLLRKKYFRFFKSSKYIFFFFCAKLPHTGTHSSNFRIFFLRNCVYCVKVGAYLQSCALKNHYSAPHIQQHVWTYGRMQGGHTRKTSFADILTIFEKIGIIDREEIEITHERE